MAIKVAQSMRSLPPPVLLLGQPLQNVWLEESLRREGFDVLFPHGSLATLEHLERTLLDFQSQFAELSFVHPGTHFWAGRPELFHVCQKLGLNLISASATVLSLFANRLSLLDRAHQLQIPNLVLDFEPISSRREAEVLFQRHNRASLIVFRAVLRSQLGSYSYLYGHDKNSAQDLDLWLEQLQTSTGESIFFAEKYLGESRRISQAFCREGSGDITFLPAVDTSLQVTTFGRQKPLLNVCPAPQLSTETRQLMQDYSKKLLDQIRFIGVGSFEFIVDGDRPYLVDGCPHLDNTFPIWEKQSGLSAIQLQLTAMETQRGAEIQTTKSQPGITAGIFIYAEDPVYLLPRPGRIHEQKYQEVPRVQCQLFYSEPSEVSIHDTGELAHLFAQGQQLEDCLNLLNDSLSHLWMAGSMQNNQRYLQSLLQHTWIKEGIFHSRFLDEEFVPEYRNSLELLQSLALTAGKILQGGPSPARGHWSLGGRLIVQQDMQTLHSERIEPWRLENGLPGLKGSVHFPKLGYGHSPFLLYPLNKHCWILSTQMFSGLARFIPLPQSPLDQYPLYAQTTGIVNSLLYQADRRVPAHQPLVVIRSLDNLVPHALPSSVDLVQWLVRPGQQVSLGENLAWFKKAEK